MQYTLTRIRSIYWNSAECAVEMRRWDAYGLDLGADWQVHLNVAAHGCGVLRGWVGPTAEDEEVDGLTLHLEPPDAGWLWLPWEKLTGIGWAGWVYDDTMFVKQPPSEDAVTTAVEWMNR